MPKTTSQRHPSPGIGSIVIENVPMFVMFILGGIIFWDWNWLYSLLYLAYCGLALMWFMRFICTYCGNARLGRCPSGMGHLALRLFARNPPRRFGKQFRKHMGLLFPCWFAPLLAAIYLLVTGFTAQRLVFLVAFLVVGFVLLPLVSRRSTCEDCVMGNQCPWSRSGNKRSRADNL